MTEPRRRRRARKTRSHPSPTSHAEEAALEADHPALEDDGEDRIFEPDDALPHITLSELAPNLQDACKRVGWPELMPVQQMTIPYILQRRDLMIQSRTGSGKTGAFLLPMLDRIDPDLAQCQALILVPTRELAQQVYDQAQILATPGVRTIAVYGGVGYGKQLEAFEKGAHLVVGTPGRVLDHLLRGSLKLDHIAMLVFDEADRMLSMGFYQDMKRVKRYMPDKPRNSYMFSATFPYHVMRLAGDFLTTPDMLSLSRDRVHVSEVDHVLCNVPDMKKDRVLIKLIEEENPTAAIIFCNTKAETSYVALILKRFGYDADALSSDLKQKDREKVLNRVRQGKLRFLVATDVAARGIDIVEISHVFQYEVPEDPEVYVHRAGRTGRAGSGGKAIIMAYRMDKIRIGAIREQFKIDFEERDAPTDEENEGVVSQRLTALLEASLRDRSNLERERMQRFLPLARQLAGNDDESVIIAMLLDDRYQQSLHAPVAEELPEEPAPPAPSSHGGSGDRKSGPRRGGVRGGPRGGNRRGGRGRRD